MRFWHRKETNLAGKKVVHAQTVAKTMAGIAHLNTDTLREKFVKIGFMKYLTPHQQLHLYSELLAFELTCQMISLSKTYGERANKILPMLIERAFNTLGVGLKLPDISDCVESGQAMVMEHHARYAFDIVELSRKTDKREYEMNAGYLGWKILDWIFRAIFWETEAPSQGWDSLPEQPALAQLCLQHAVSNSSEKPVLEEFVLADE